MAEGGGPAEAGFLDIPTYALAGILCFFLIVSLLFEKGTHHLVLYLKKRKRNGLAQAVSNLTMELTLVGLVSLLLIVLQNPISSICVPYSVSSVTYWSLIGNVQGCDCCLANTAAIGACFAQSRECGPEFCNCNALDPSCLAAEVSLREVLGEWQGDAACTADTCSQTYLQRMQNNTQLAAVSAMEAQCDGMVAVDEGKCGPGKTPLITKAALEQVHIFIFTVAVVHVVMGTIMILLSSWRVHNWQKAAGLEDEHVREVREMLDKQARAARPKQGPTGWARLFQPGPLRRHAGGGGGAASLFANLMHGKGLHTGNPGSPTAASAMELGRASGAFRHGSREGQDGEAGGEAARRARVRQRWRRAAAAALAQARQAQNDDKLAASSGSSGGSGDVEATASSGYVGLGLPANPASHGSQVNMLEPVASRKLKGTMLPDVATKPDVRRSDSVRVPGARRSADGGWDLLAGVREYFICFLHQFHPRPISHQDLSLMRASFMLFHRVPAGFNFYNYVLLSVEDDLQQIVGVSLEMWLTLVIFVLVSGPLGWMSLIFICMAAAVLVIINCKLQAVLRHVCRGAHLNKLSSNIFWFKKPDLMLIPIKYLLFLCSFMFASSIFFLWSFGARSCPFTSIGNRFWLAWLPPWWVVLIISGVIFLDASVRTLPCYSLAVQCGSDFKHHMLPQGVRHKLLQIAERVKEKHKAQLAAEAAAAAGGPQGGAALKDAPSPGHHKHDV